MIATIQALGFTAIYLGGTFAILGINPIKKYKQMKIEADNLARLSEQDPEGTFLPRDGSFDIPKDKMTPGQLKLVEGLNKLGISNEAIMSIEDEMRKK